MALVKKRIQLQCNLKNLSDAEREIGQLKMVIGLLIAKLPQDDRENIILDLKNFDLEDSAKEFTQFVFE
ncbi:hypothetical protein AB6870_23535 [Rahnella inusitata]|uniref:hypothetical protein n=1 Tax=Rahnella inusitata TaxID=58169 RepID=UPI0039BE6A15